MKTISLLLPFSMAVLVSARQGHFRNGCDSDLTPTPMTPTPTTPVPTTPVPTTPEPTTPEVTTPEVTTPEPTTPEVTTPEPTTPEPTTPEVTTPEPTTPEVTTPEPTTPGPTTPEPTTPEPTTPEPTTPEPTTPTPTTPAPTLAPSSNILFFLSGSDVHTFQNVPFGMCTDFAPCFNNGQYSAQWNSPVWASGGTATLVFYDGARCTGNKYAFYPTDAMTATASGISSLKSFSWVPHWEPIDDTDVLGHQNGCPILP